MCYLYEELLINNFYLYLNNIINFSFEIDTIKYNTISYKKNISTLSYKIFNNELFNQHKYLYNIKIELLNLNIYLLEQKSQLNFYNHKIKESNLKKVSFYNEQNIYLCSEYNKVYYELRILEDNFYKIYNTYKNTLILSPISGIINNIDVRSGEYINNKYICEIVPQNKDLILEGLVPVQEIDNIFIGGTVKIHINTYNSRFAYRILGKVIYISNDKIKQGKVYENNKFYKVKVLLCNEELNRYNISLYPGMTAKIFILKGKKSVAEYIFSPIKSIFYKSLIEN
jgi:hypothetical protein